MFIVMHCGGMPFNGETIKKQSLGGSETAAYYMASELAKKHKVTIFTNSQETGVFDGVRYEWAGDVTEAAPLGDRFNFYASNTPHDVCIIQRHPQAFQTRYASKVNLLWLHDLALKRNEPAINSSMLNVDGVLTVSQYHKDQICEVWGLNPKAVYPITNGIDLSLFDQQIERDPYSLVYSSRPERGLLKLVGPDGIMERLEKIEPRFKLAVCAYENRTAHMEDLYDYLESRCETLPNVQNVGALTKDQLAELMLSSGALIYPTTFEEVSCITAMEAMAAGMHFIASEHAALPETCKGSGATLIPLKDGEPDKDAFIAALLAKVNDEAGRKLQTEKAKEFAWEKAAQKLEAVFLLKMGAANFRPESVRNFLIRQSDIPAFEHYGKSSRHSPVLDQQSEEFDKGYAFYRNATFATHYKDYYEYERDRGVEYGPEDVSNTVRFGAVANIVGGLPSGSTVLDYGCAHGHYTVNLAKRFPNLRFVGRDLAASNIAIANKWSADEGLTNITFEHGTHETISQSFDLVIAAEVVEHVAKPQELVDSLCSRLTESGKIVITTPYGPWEAQGYREHGYWRAHLHHFDRADLHEAFGHHPGFGITAAPSGDGKFATSMGSYITVFSKPSESSKPIDYVRKLRELVPQGTLSVCIIAKDAEADIRRCVQSVIESANEIIIGIDETTKDHTRQVVDQLKRENPLVAWNVFQIKSPTEIGFAEARNLTIKEASCDWILWIDTDEVMINASQLFAFMRRNQYNGYAVKQHHFSVQPAGIIKTDLPVRLFRNDIGVKFYGYVHEHPELSMNEGMGHVALLPGVEIAHHGYATETIRRKRFSRNIGLLVKDRKENPKRILGKFLWLRDLAQMNQYDVEYKRADPAVMFKRADEGIALWRELVKDNLRMAVDGLPYYSELVGIKGEGFEFSFAVDASKTGEARCSKVSSVDGRYETTDDAFALMTALAKEKVSGFESRYF